MIKIYGTKWCGDCYLALKIIQAHKIEYEWIDIDKDPQAEKFVIHTNHGFRSVPTIVFDDDTILVEPSRGDLIKKLSNRSTIGEE
jgi:glutaredoxin